MDFDALQAWLDGGGERESVPPPQPPPSLHSEAERLVSEIRGLQDLIDTEVVAICYPGATSSEINGRIENIKALQDQINYMLEQLARFT